jgi:hypothetical protein
MPNQNDMPNEKNMLIEAYRIQVERWNKRRDIEWRLTLTLWSTILIITFAIAGKIQPLWFDILIIYMVLFGVYWHWVRGLWIRNAEDKDWMYRYQEKINTKLLIYDKLDKGTRPNKPLKWWRNYFKVWKDWSACSQLLLTLVILVSSGLILCFLPESEPSLLSFILKTLIR